MIMNKEKFFMKKVILGSVMIFTGVFAFIQMFNTVSVMVMSYISNEVLLVILAGVFVALVLAALAFAGVVIGFKGAFDKAKTAEKSAENNNG